MSRKKKNQISGIVFFFLIPAVILLSIVFSFNLLNPEYLQKLKAASYTFTVPDASDWSAGTYDNTAKTGTDLVLSNKTLQWLQTTTANFTAGATKTNLEISSDQVALGANTSDSFTTGNSKLNTSNNINDVYYNGTYYFLATASGLDVIDPTTSASKGYISLTGGFSSVIADSTYVYAGDADGGVYRWTISNISGNTAVGSAIYTTSTTPAIISNNVNEIHIETISSKTYLAVATSGGVTVVNVTDSASADSSEITAYDVVFLTTDNTLYYGDDGNTNLQRKDSISGAADGFTATREYSTSSSPDLFSANLNDIFVTIDTSTAETGSNTVFLATDEDIEVIQEHSTMASSTVKHYDYSHNWLLSTNDSTLESSGSGTNLANINDGSATTFWYESDPDSYFIYSFKEEDAYSFNKATFTTSNATTAVRKFKIFTSSTSAAKTDVTHASWAEVVPTAGSSASTKSNVINKWIDPSGTTEAYGSESAAGVSGKINDGYTSNSWHSAGSSEDDYFIFSFKDSGTKTINQLSLYNYSTDNIRDIKHFLVYTSTNDSAKTDPLHSSWTITTPLTGSSGTTKANLLNQWSSSTLTAYDSQFNSTTYAADNTINGNYASAWLSANADPLGYFIYAFQNEAAQTIDTLTLYNDRTAALAIDDFRVMTSSDVAAKTDPNHASWTTVLSGSANCTTLPASEQFTWTATSVKYVQFKIDTECSNSDTRTKIFDIEITGSTTLQDYKIYEATSASTEQTFTWSDTSAKYVLVRILDNYGTGGESGYGTRSANEIEIYGTATLQDDSIFAAPQDGTTNNYTWSATSAKYLMFRVLDNHGDSQRRVYELEYYNQGSLAGTANKSLAVVAKSDASTMWAASNGTGADDGAVSEITVSSGSQAAYYQASGTTPTILDNDVSGIAQGTNGNYIIIGTDSAGASALEKTGILISSIYDFGTSNTEWGAVSWNATSNSQTMTVKARTSNDANMSGATDWSSVSTITSGDDISTKTGVADGQRYLQYRLDFSTTNFSQNPSLQDITLSAAKIYGTHLMAFDGLGEADWYSFAWTAASEPTNTDIKLRFRTSTNNSTWSSWSSYATTSPADLTSVGLNLTATRYLQIQSYLETTANDTTPQLDTYTLTYSQNGPTEIQNVTVSQDSDGQVNISYQIRDADTNSGSVNPGYTDVSFQYYNGTTWVDCATTTGEGLKAVQEVNYTTYSGTWNAKTDFADQYLASTVKIRINTDDHELLYNTASADSSAFELDTKAPTLGGTPITINSAATKTNSTSITLTVSASDDTSLYMAFSSDNSTYGTIVDTNGQVTNASTWEGYTTTKAWTLTAGTDGTRTAYVKFKDAKGNTTSAQSDTITLDKTAADIPSNVTIADSSDNGIGRYWLTIGWTPVATAANPDFSAYSLERSTDSGTTYAEIVSFSSITNEVYVDTGLNQDITYYYRLKTKDNISNYSDPSTVVSYQPASFDDAPPDLSGEAPVAVCTVDSCVVGWTTDESSTSCVEYGITTDYGMIVCDLDYVLDHEMSVLDLVASTTYHYRVISVDANGNKATGTDYDMATQASDDDTNPPVLGSEGPIISVADTSAIIAWQTDELSDSFVLLGSEEDLFNGVLQGKDESVTDHVVTISGLTSQRKYYFKVQSTDVADNTASSDIYDFTTTLPEEANNPPEISDIESQAPGVSTTSVMIGWVTTTYANSQVLYGTTEELGQASEVDSVLNKKHFVTLEGLTPATAYYYRVRSEDTYGNVTTSDLKNFTTSAIEIITEPTISNISTQTPGSGATSVNIIWTTDSDTTSQILYGITKDLGQTSKEDTVLTKKHFFTITDLVPNTLYYYKVRSKDSHNNVTFSSPQTFRTTKQLTGNPKISGVQVTDITLNSAIISWSTFQVTTTDIQYGPTISYGSSIVDESISLTTQHVVRVPSLSSGTTYHFRIYAKDADGNPIASDDYVFNTLSLPVVSDVTTADIKDRQATVSWITNVETSGIVEYGQDTNYGLSQGSSALTTSHSLTLIGLEPDILYHFRISVQDSYGNKATLGDNTLRTSRDANPPEISGVTYEVSTVGGTDGKVQAIISWVTDELATSRVIYNAGIAPPADENVYVSQTQEDPTLNSSHVVIISDLKPSTTYHFRVKSIDNIKNIAVSEDYSLLTPRQTKSVLGEIIISLETRFIWLSKIKEVFGL